MASFLGRAPKKSLDVQEPNFATAFVDSTQVQRETHLREISLPKPGIGDEPQREFFGVDPKKLPLFSAPKKPKKSTGRVLSYTSRDTITSSGL
jgi:hypothetical protein